MNSKICREVFLGIKNTGRILDPGVKLPASQTTLYAPTNIQKDGDVFYILNYGSDPYGAEPTESSIIQYNEATDESELLVKFEPRGSGTDKISGVYSMVFNKNKTLFYMGYDHGIAKFDIESKALTHVAGNREDDDTGNTLLTASINRKCIIFFILYDIILYYMVLYWIILYCIML